MAGDGDDGAGAGATGGSITDTRAPDTWDVVESSGNTAALRLLRGVRMGENGPDADGDSGAVDSLEGVLPAAMVAYTCGTARFVSFMRRSYVFNNA